MFIYAIAFEIYEDCSESPALHHLKPSARGKKHQCYPSMLQIKAMKRHEMVYRCGMLGQSDHGPNLNLTMLEGLLLIDDIVVMTGLQGVDVQRHVPCGAAADWEASLGIQG